MTKKPAADKRPRRERGSLKPEDIIDGAFELAADTSLDDLSMPQLAKHLDVGVTSIYWYFRKKDELLNAMTDRGFLEYENASPFVETDDWQETLRNHASTMRSIFLNNPILIDLILIRAELSPRAAQVGAALTEKVVANLVEAGMSLDDAVDIYSAIQLHTRGSIVLQRLYDRNKAAGDERGAYYEQLQVFPKSTPLLSEAASRGHHSGAPDDHNFEYGLDAILERAARLVGTSADRAPSKKAAARPAKKSTPAKKTTTARKSASPRRTRSTASSGE
ncbi:TetR/AcrR family transcriptional regulator [Nocardia sp. NPDC055321]